MLGCVIEVDCVELRTVRNSSDAGYANARFSGQSTRMAARCVSSGETDAFKCALQAPQKISLVTISLLDAPDR